MYPHQIERLTNALDAAGVEALVATSAANVTYVTGFRSFTHTLLHTLQFSVFTRRGTALVVPAADVAAAVADEAEIDHVLCFGEPHPSSGELQGPFVRRVQAIVGRRVPTAVEALAAALDVLAVREGAIALDEALLPGDDREWIAERLRHLRVVPGSAHLSTARRVKAPFEIEYLAGALRIAEEALNEVVQMLKRGVTEREATTLYLTEIVKRGGEPSPSSITMGDRTGLGSAWPSERALRPGELVRLDVGCVHRGYVARVGRTAVLGEPTSEQATAHGAIQDALEAAVDAAAPGRTAKEVYEAAVGAMRERRLPDFRCARIGHGIGLELGEPPSLAPDDATPLEAGEVLSIEVAHHVSGQQGFIARDTVLVTVGGARVLNRSARGLVTLD
jgi:Xaa-Pro aminopeptidase